MPSLDLKTSIYYGPVGSVPKRVEDPDEIAAIEANEVKEFQDCIVRDNQVLRPIEMTDRRISRKQMTIFRNGRDVDGFDRNNAVGDVADLATGYQIAIDTLTYVKKKTSDQKFYKVAPGKFMPVITGEGAFSNQLLTNRSYFNGDDFESGNIRTGASNARLTTVTVSIDGVNVPVMNWAKELGYTIFDVEQALRANNWDIIGKKHQARKELYDLGIQKVAFLGLSSQQAAFPGLLTNPNINTNTSLITGPISQMTGSQLNTFVSTLIGTYFANTASTAMPNRFVIPMQDWTGLPVQTPNTVGQYPVPEMKYLLEAFKAAVSMYEPDFQILGNAYCDPANNPAGLHYYLLYRDDDTSLRMDLPVPYTTTQPNSLNNFSFQDVAYAQYTGANVYRNLESLRFQY